MNKTRLKILLWAAIGLVFVGAAFLAFRGVTQLIVYFQEGADPASALNIVPNVPPDLQTRLTWRPDDPDTGREMEPLTRRDIQSAYLRAWLQWNLSYEKGEPHGLSTYFVGPALAAVEQAVADVAAQGWQVDQIDTTHDLRLHFYAADGSIVAFTDERANVAQAVRDASGQEVLVDETDARYEVVMFLEDGNWRVRHWVRRDLEDVPDPPARAGGTFATVAPTAVGSTILLAEQRYAPVAYGEAEPSGEPFYPVGVNYYPQATPWEFFWAEYDTAVIDADFARMGDLDLNTIRIFVPYDQFGGPVVDPDMLAKLKDLLDRAEAHGLMVIVTLFDFRPDYDLLRWPDADRHLEAIVAPLADHHAILAWDLKNQPDLDYERNGVLTTQAWLRHTAALVRSLDPNHLVTVGWSNPEAATALLDTVDLVSFHYYREAGQLADALAVLETAVAASGDKPILLTEFGLPSWNSRFFPDGHSEEEQAVYVADVRQALADSAVAGYLVWTLYDFDYVSASAGGRLPWRRGPEQNLGVLRADGSEKPAAALLAPDATFDDLPEPPPRFLKPFWQTVAIGLVGATAVVAVLIWFFLRRRRRA